MWRIHTTGGIEVTRRLRNVSSKATKRELRDTYSASVNELLWFAQTMLQDNSKPRR